MNKQERKEIKKAVRSQEQEQLLSVLPMPQNLLKSFFDYLDEKLTEGSRYGKDLQLTATFCSKNDLDFEKVKDWAADLGGYDDAEILWNCEEKYEFLIESGEW